MQGDLKSFRASLDEAASVATEFLANDENGVYLKAALTEFDLLRSRSGEGAEMDEGNANTYFFLSMGISRFVSIALSSVDRFSHPTINFCRIDSIALRVQWMLSWLGVLEHGRRLAQAVANGYFDISISADGSYDIVRAKEAEENRSSEVDIFNDYNSQYREGVERVMAMPVMRLLHEKAISRMNVLVEPFAGSFIQYGAHPDSDLYFHARSIAHVQGSVGFDEFHHSCEFGGIPFSKYVLGLCYVVATAMKHEVFARILENKNPGVLFENTVNVTLDIAPFVDSMCDSMNEYGPMYDGYVETSREQAERIFDVLSVGRSTLEMLDRPGCAMPPLVRYSDTAFIRCLHGTYESSTQFMLDTLRTRFPDDFDRNQKTREGSMQRALRRVTSGVVPGLLFSDNVRLRRFGRILTDVDTAIFEPSTGLLVLVQLKHFDMYGTDLAAKFTRTGRLNERSSKWLSATGGWLRDASPDEVKSAFRLPRGAVVERIERLILAKHYASSLWTICRESGAYGANWMRWCYAADDVLKSGHEVVSLSHLLDRIKTGEAFSTIDAIPRPDQTFVLGKLRFRVRGHGVSEPL